MGTVEHLSKNVLERTYSSRLTLNVIEGEFKEVCIGSCQEVGESP